VDTLGELTTVKIKKDTREKLAELGSKKETYDDIIRRLIEFYEENSKNRLDRKG
jgi:predicted CopG family antitoxin